MSLQRRNRLSETSPAPKSSSSSPINALSRHRRSPHRRLLSRARTSDNRRPKGRTWEQKGKEPSVFTYSRRIYLEARPSTESLLRDDPSFTIPRYFKEGRLGGQARVLNRSAEEREWTNVCVLRGGQSLNWARSESGFSRRSAKIVELIEGDGRLMGRQWNGEWRRQVGLPDFMWQPDRVKLIGRCRRF